ncbi:MAG: hypothetical protein LBK67_04185 [Coriobacteriales bacterium]|nr:hypothetical protein [Coriobacteriales bacterium]
MSDTTALMLNPTVPYDPFVGNYINFAGIAIPYEYTGWEAETLAWKESCYLSANLSGAMACHSLSGPDALKVLNEWLVNDFTDMEIGAGRHGIMVTRKGNVIEHGMILRFAENEFGAYAFQPYLNFIVESGRYDVELIASPLKDLPVHDFIYQLAGPRSLEIVEQAARQDLHDLGFMRFTDAKIAGHAVRIIRMGMGGTLSYEVHGPLAASHDVYNALFTVGAPYGMKKMGWWSYMCNHTENGFPQIGNHFPYPFVDEPEFLEYVRSNPFAFDPTLLPPLGSLSDDINDYFRNPYELGWEHMVDLNHDFHGRDALLEIAKDHRVMVTLLWNADDILEVERSWYTPGAQPYRKVVRPYDYAGNGFGNCQEKVLSADGALVGVSMHETYTLYYQQTISLCSIDSEYAGIGTEVFVEWGGRGCPVKRIRATVARYPYLDLAANRDYDIGSIPRYKD